MVHVSLYEFKSFVLDVLNSLRVQLLAKGNDLITSYALAVLCRLEALHNHGDDIG